MIKGSNWPIPSDRILDGAIISLKNAYRLAKDAEILLKEKKFSTAISISTLALEEFGKHCLLEEDEENNHPREIDAKIWHDEFEGHQNKLEAITRRLKKFSNPKDQEKQRKLDELNQYLIDLSKTKLKALYVDWDGQNNDWYYFDDDSPTKEEEAKKAVSSAIFAIEKYIEDVEGDIDLVLTEPKKISVLLDQRKIHCFCKVCSRIMITRDEFISHNNICRNVPSWYWNS